MSILVVNCGHWIGYHIVDDLLESDFQVDGISISPNTEDLLMFFERNSSFTLTEDPEEKQYDTSIIVGNHGEEYNINAKRIFGIQHKSDKLSKFVSIHTPFLFGEWMPMDENGCYRNKEYISFESDWFKENAIYIKDFTKVLIQLVETTTVPRNIDLKHGKSSGMGIYVTKQENIENKIEQVRKHYKLYRHLY